MVDLSKVIYPAKVPSATMNSKEWLGRSRVYVSGPMRGIDEFNFPAFNEAAKVLRGQGYDVINPAETFDGATDRKWEDYMRVDIESLLQVDEVALLPNWQNSVGVKVELTVAAALGLRVWDYTTGEDVDVSWLIQPGATEVAAVKKTDQETALQAAQRIVHGARQKDYGHPYDDFKKTAGYWSVLFGIDVKPWQVAMAQWLLKTSRLQNTPTHYDSVVDVAGYAGTYDLVIGKAKELGEVA